MRPEDWAGPEFQRGRRRPSSPAKGQGFAFFRLPAVVGPKKILPKKRYAFFGSLSCHSLEALKG